MQTGEGGNSQVSGESLVFAKILDKHCMKMKGIRPSGPAILAQDFDYVDKGSFLRSQRKVVALQALW